MPPVSVLVVWITIVVLLVAVVVISRRKERERTEVLRREAETAELVFETQADVAKVRSLGEVQLFARGHSKRVTNLMTGRLGDQQVAVFDYRYTVGAGKSQHTSVQTVVLLPSAKPALPDLQMAPESPLYKIAEAMGYQDINIESSPEFSRRYIVKGKDEVAIRTALYPRATSFFAEHQGWTVEVQSGTVAIYRANNRPKAEDVRTFLEEARAAVHSL